MLLALHLCPAGCVLLYLSCSVTDIARSKKPHEVRFALKFIYAKSAHEKSYTTVPLNDLQIHLEDYAILVSPAS